MTADGATSADRLLLVGVGKLGRGYLTAARALGVRVVLVERQQLLAELAEEGHDVDEVHECAGMADQYWVAAALTAAASGAGLSGVVAYAEPQVVAAAWARQASGLPGVDVACAVASRDKALQRVLLDRAGVSQPEFLVTDSAADAVRFAARHGVVMVKALRASGSRGVSSAPGPDDVRARFADLGPGESLLVEQYVDGPEFSAEVLVENGAVRFVNYTAKGTTGPPEFVETGHVLPAALPPDAAEAVDALVAGVVRGLGVDSGLVHTEFRVSGAKAYVIETALRTPGDHIMELIGLAYGIDLYERVVDLALGRPMRPVPPACGTAAIRYVGVAPGTVRAVDGVGQARGLSGVHEVSMPCRPGDVVGPVTASADRGGYVIAVGQDEVDVRDRLDHAVAVVRVSTSPAATGPVSQVRP